MRSLQINNNFDKAIEVEANKTYVRMNDNFFFKQSCDLVFQSGVKGVVWQKYEPEIRKELKNYRVKQVAKFNKKDVERMISNPKMIKNRRKIEACVHNARRIVTISEEYNGFWHFLDSHNIPELVEKIKSNFKWMGYTNAYAFLRYVGLEVIKPDVNVLRVMYRLRLIDNEKRSIETYKQIQEAGMKLAEANGVRMAVVDYTLYLFGSGEKPFVKYAVCGNVPKCDECPVRTCKAHSERCI